MTAQSPMPLYQCHKQVWALKIRQVVKHAHTCSAVDPDRDATFEASEMFEGAHLFPEDERFAPISVDSAYYRKHKPHAGGYYVVYKDGYKSFSPAEAFEDGYTLVD